MKKKFLLIAFLSMLLLLLPACGFQPSGSVKALTRPYIAVYECTEARLGKTDLLEKYEYITITLLDKEELEVSFKPKNGDKSTFKGAYEVDTETRELTGETGILGFKFREKVRIEKGKFTIVKNFCGLPLYMLFEMK